MDRSDKIRLQHMIDAADEALKFAENKTIDDFRNNRMLVLSIVKDIEIIGEAASKISSPTLERFDKIPWKDIIGMRNRLIHGYFDVDIMVIKQTIDNDLPQLLKQLKRFFLSKLKHHLSQLKNTLLPRHSVRHTGLILKRLQIIEIPFVISNQCIFVGIFW